MPAAIRLTVHPGEDVLLPTGVPIGMLRDSLADLLRRPELRHAALWADGVQVAPGSVVGERPLLAGAVLRVGRADGGGARGARADDGGAQARRAVWSDDAALRSPWLVARTTGAESGELAGLEPGSPLVLPGRVTVRVDARGTVRVAVRPGFGGSSARLVGGLRRAVSHRAPRAGGVRAAGLGSALAADHAPAVRAVLLRRDGRRRRVGLLGRRWRPGEILDAGERYAVHRSGDAATLLDGLAEAAPGPASTQGPGLAGTLVTALLPAAGSIGLAVALRQPTFALFAIVGVLAAIPQVAAAVRRRRGGDAPATPASPAPSGVPGRPRTLDPVLLARAALAAERVSGGGWRAAVAARSAASGVPLPGAPTEGPPRRTLLLDGALAVRGPRPHAAAAARAVVAGLVAEGARVRVIGSGRDGWSWCRWHDGSGSDGAVPAADAVLVVDSPAPADLDAAHAAHRAGADVVLCLGPQEAVPSWCRDVLDVVGASGQGPTGRAAGIRTRSGGGASRGPLVGVGEAWAERFARRLAGARGLGRDVGALWPTPDGARAGSGQDLPAGADPADPRLPSVVPLTRLLADPPPGGAAGARQGSIGGADGTSTWASATDDATADGAWAVPLGIDADGRTVTFDLVEDGPHLLVAGTTGAGKSELLQAFVLTLALRRTPGELALALIDFKGGASFGACAGLPHVVGQVTDLDAGLAARALEGLRAELRRRKEVLASHGVADLAALPADVLPRLVVVVDEFRALADDLPDLLPGLLRVAAQGRSLGVHLVLATQRPAGAVSADVRANVSARLALRVVDAADSHDVLDSPAAAHVPAGVPGRAVLRVGAERPVALQCAYAGASPDDAAPTVSRAPAWSDPDHRPQPAGPGTRVPAGGPTAHLPSAAASDGPADRDARSSVETPDPVAALVARAHAAAPVGSPRWPAPWLPPLPQELTTLDLGPVPDGALPLALGDSPSTQSRVPVAWHPGTGHLAVLGRARTGRSTVLRTLAAAALDRGWHVHALVPQRAAVELEPLAGHPGLGTVAGPEDPRRAARLLRLIQRPAPGTPPVLVLVDGVEELRSALASPVDDPLATALAAGTAAFALTAESAGLGGLAARCGPRLVLLSADAAGDSMLGAPSPLAGRGRTPGRGVWLAGGDPLECQVALPAPVPAPSSALADGVPGRVASSARPVRVLPLPRHVDGAGLGSAHPTAVGIGGDDAAPVGLDVTSGALVVGPRGSGRTATLRVLLGTLSCPRAPVVIARDRALTADAERRGAVVVPPTPTALRTLLDDLTAASPGASRAASPGAGGPGAAAHPPLVLLIDDADAVVQAAPLETDRLAELAVDGAVTVVAAATTLAAGIAHRGLLAHLRATRTGVVLSPADRGADEVFGTALDDAAEPGVRLPGRGALIVDGVVSAVQLAAPAASGAAAPHATGGLSAASSPRPHAA
ncbi:cell divisionFtsK/SpoIIIE [Xylanimonas cellulosilytica DSM 15894]|uniref:Cell divisionFtsK/SpoIIIE n=1 Tax=Xylanimonas cellulosilytica (strain DSM 15894 / JCM 12276 / CECT 5975 / KCTC 9989 / LMG 20990 / NBRC 107835 / XIL07) TaxID=446471 RepID=D1BX52_XYLCX|nr:FtsK/SpoIIIE domain-containing protein [Xylanimonas cellulosilytica]ACZ31620.1 cell divisionFtsK/SpoIIIE [Xylanimonas cellulosilytica DSM 15894]